MKCVVRTDVTVLSEMASLYQEGNIMGLWTLVYVVVDTMVVEYI